MIILQFADHGVRQAARHAALKGLPKIARGTFCAVYDKGETVMKMTCDRVQYGFATDYCAPKGVFFPTMIENHGVIGQTAHGDAIYLYETEKLKPARRDSGPAINRIVTRLIKLANAHYSKHAHGGRYGNSAIRKVAGSSLAMNELAADESLPEDLREALSDIGSFVCNYDAVIDFHRANIMLRGSQVVLNDVVADPVAVDKGWVRAYGNR